MSTYYEETLKLVGTNEFTTNATYKAALDQQQEIADEALRRQEFNEFWMWTMLLLAGLTVFFLLKIYLQNQNKLKASHPQPSHPNGEQKVNKKPVAEKYPTAKPPLLEIQNQKADLHMLPEKEPTAANDYDPDWKYKPKA